MLPKAVKKHLKKDPILARIVDTPIDFSKHLHANSFSALLSSIVSQQLSVKAAATIHGRFVDIFDSEGFGPEEVLAKSHEKLRAVGLSNQKAKYVKNVSQFYLDHKITDAHLEKLDDNEVIKLLSQIKGVGTWTVQMIMMFHLGREDVFPVDDLSIQQKTTALYKLEGPLKETKKKMHVIAENWKPYRSYASRLLWAYQLENQEKK